MRSIDFTVARFRRAPKRYRFFAVGETVWFGDKDQVDRFNAEPDYAETHELHAWTLSAGDFENPATTRWIADRLNHATGRTR